MTLPQRLLPTSEWPVYERTHLQTLEQTLQSQSTVPLMQLAGHVAARLALAIAPHAQNIWIAAGSGNNGGDGLEAALNLHLLGKQVTVSLMGKPDDLPYEAQRAWQRATNAGVKILQGHLPPALLNGLTPRDLCIDALLGLGVSRPITPPMSTWINAINQVTAQRLALDLPSGLNPDSGQPLCLPETTALMVKADHTLTFIGAKPGLFMGHGRDVCGQIWLADLRTPQETFAGYMNESPQPDAWLNPHRPSSPKSHASHKGSCGDVAVVGGEALEHRGMGMTGAALLAAQAALHAGAGRVIVSLLGDAGHCHVPHDLMQRAWTQLQLEKLCVVAGCGGGQAVQAIMSELLLRSAHLVLDADGLNTVANDSLLQQQLQQRAGKSQPTVISPHPLEAARLLRSTTAQVQGNRLEAAKELAAMYQCTVVLKGSGTVIMAPQHKPRINTSGDGKLAIGGTGDVLAGVIGAQMARGHTGYEAACQSVQLHGQAANEWPKNLSLTASRLARHVH